MKVRFLNNSIRFRISKNELDLLAKGESVSSSTNFPSNIFHISILPSKKEEIEVDFKNHNIRLIMPIDIVKKMHESDSVGHYETLEISSEQLEVIFEKDYKCLTDRGDDEAELFENPNQSH